MPFFQSNSSFSQLTQFLHHITESSLTIAGSDSQFLNNIEVFLMSLNIMNEFLIYLLNSYTQISVLKALSYKQIFPI